MHYHTPPLRLTWSELCAFRQYYLICIWFQLLDESGFPGLRNILSYKVMQEKNFFFPDKVSL